MYTVKICKPYGDHLVEAQRVNVSRSTNSHYWQAIAMKLCSNDPDDAESLINLARGGDDLQVPTSFVWFYEEGNPEPQYVWIYESEAVYIMNAKGVTIEKVYSTYTAKLGDTLGMEDGKPTTKTLRERLLEEFGGTPKTSDNTYVYKFKDDVRITVHVQDEKDPRYYSGSKLIGVDWDDELGLGNKEHKRMRQGLDVARWERIDTLASVREEMTPLQKTRDWASWVYTKDIGSGKEIMVFFKDKDQHRVFFNGARVTNHAEIANLINNIKLHYMSNGKVITGWQRTDLDTD